MLENPDIPNEKIIVCLAEQYGLQIVQVTFLPLGADLNTTVYQVDAADRTSYFLKLRRGDFDEAAVTFPKFLFDQGLTQIIAPLPTKTAQLWAKFTDFTMILYPFIVGENGYEVKPNERHWSELGTVLKQMHTAKVPVSITRHIRQETYDSHWRDIVTETLPRLERTTFSDPGATQLAASLQAKQDAILDLIRQAERLANLLQIQSSDAIVCHADIHAGNIFIDADGAFYLVDWDTLVLAPKERDLMYIGGALMGGWYTPEEEERLFYPTYGPTEIDPVPMAYYRYERIIEDIAVYCQQLFGSEDSMGREDLAQCVEYFSSDFRPNGVVEVAYQSDQTRNK